MLVRFNKAMPALRMTARRVSIEYASLVTRISHPSSQSKDGHAVWPPGKA